MSDTDVDGARQHDRVTQDGGGITLSQFILMALILGIGFTIAVHVIMWGFGV